MEKEVLVIFFKKSKFKQHLLYIIDNKILIDVGKKHTIIKNININKLNLVLKIFEENDYKTIDKIKIRCYYKNNKFMKLNLYNCISTGKILLNVSGIYFSCNSFFNKLKIIYGK